MKKIDVANTAHCTEEELAAGTVAQLEVDGLLARAQPPAPPAALRPPASPCTLPPARSPARPAGTPPADPHLFVPDRQTTRRPSPHQRCFCAGGRRTPR